MSDSASMRRRWYDRAPQSDPGATEHVLRRCVRRPYNRAGFGTASTGATHLQGAPVALAHIAELRGQLPFHRHCLDQSPLPHALCHGGDPSSVVVQFRAPVFHVTASAPTAWMAVSELAPQPVAFYAAVFFLVNATYVLLLWELIGRTPADKNLAERAQDHAFAIDRDFEPFRSRRGGGAEIPAAWTRNLYFLPDRLSESPIRRGRGIEYLVRLRGDGFKANKCRLKFRRSR
jgi:hypothetical protein